MRINNTKNKTAFKSVYMNVFNNGSPRIIEECLVLKNQLALETGKTLHKAQEFYKPNTSEFKEFNFFVT